MKRYILAADGRTPVEEPDLMKWGKFFEDADARTVARADVSPDVYVSTVFLGIDHSYEGGPPVLFETMVFGGTMEEEMARYTTWDDAVAGHDEMVKRVRASA